MSKIPTAEEQLLSLLSDLKEDSKAEYLSDHPEDLFYYAEAFRKFAKLHVKQALEAVKNKPLLLTYDGDKQFNSYAYTNGDTSIRQDDGTILSAYPENLIV